MVRITMRDMICCILQLVWVYSQYFLANLQKMEGMKEIRSFISQEIMPKLPKLTV